MLTNLLQAITFTTLVTNTSIQYPQRMVPMPCPDGIYGCLVAHIKTVDDPNPTNRSIFTEILLKEITEIPSLKLRSTNTTRLVAWEVKEELKSYWIPAQPQPLFGTLSISNGWSTTISNISITNMSFTVKTNK